MKTVAMTFGSLVISFLACTAFCPAIASENMLEPVRKTGSLPVSQASAPRSAMPGLKFRILIDRSDIGADVQRSLFRGLRSAFQAKSRDLTRIKVYYLDRPEVDAARALQHMAREKEAQVLLAWIGKTNWNAVRPLLEASRLPVFVMNQGEGTLAPSSLLRSSYPSSLALGARLGRFVFDKGLGRIGVLQSLQHVDEAFNRGFQQAYAAAGGSISRIERYHSGDYDTLMMSLRRILSGMDPPPPLPEGTAGKVEAGVPAAVKSDVAGILVLDDFRMTRHIVKVLKFLSAEKLTLFGNYLWRSPALVEPREPYLDGSFFADHIGEYTELSFHDPKDFFQGSNMLLLPEVTESYDYAFLGEQGALRAIGLEDLAAGAGARSGAQVAEVFARMRPGEGGRLVTIDHGRLTLLK